MKREEKETVIIFNERDDVATVSTYNGRIKKSVEKAMECGDERARVIRMDGDGSAEYVIPKNWVKVRGNRAMSEEARERMVERGKALAKVRFGNK